MNLRITTIFNQLKKKPSIMRLTPPPPTHTHVHTLNIELKKNKYHTKNMHVTHLVH